MPDLYPTFTVIVESPVTNALLAIIAVASFIYAIYCRHNPSEKAELRYHISSFTLADVREFPMEEDFAFHHKGKPIERCVATIISIWNDGNKTLEASDIATKSQLAFTCRDEDAEILDARILDVTKEEAGVVPVEALYSIGQSAEQLRGHALTMGALFAAMSTVTTLAAAAFFRKARRSGIPQAIR